MDKRLRTGLAVLIATAWAVSFVIDIVNPRYEPPATVHALMLLLAGFFFGPNIIPNKRNGNGNGRHEPDSSRGEQNFAGGE